MRVALLTLFPRMVSAPLAESILGKAQDKGLLQVHVLDIRDFAEGKHHVTDDAPYGGGAGMVMKPEPLVAAIEAARAALGRAASDSASASDSAPASDSASASASASSPPRPRVILLSPQGPRFDQRAAVRLSLEPALIFVCGRYEGVDERVMPWIDEELSLGDFVLTGGEFAALAVVDAVARLLPGVLGNEQSALSESFATEGGSGAPLGALEGPQYTRPPEFRGVAVPPELLTGDHARIARWRRLQSLLRTRARRPDLFAQLELGQEDQRLLAEADRNAGPSGSGSRGPA